MFPDRVLYREPNQYQIDKVYSSRERADAQLAPGRGLEGGFS
jgi:hypothetical protein